jgi:GH25 family lysozyme M1 (1,4-beta-N-acetylmuramidase)
MLRGIDISNWQAGLDADAVFPNVDFVLCKATEGVGFVDGYCDSWVQWCRAHGKPWGFYHFAGSNQPVAEAAHFINNTSNYFGGGIPVLDWESDQSVAWVNKFVRKVHEQTGIWPWIYANPWRFNQGGVEQNCMRWIASYPDVIRPGLDYDPGEVPETDGLVGCWQYASDGRVPGYAGNLDVNLFFGDEAAWAAYAGLVHNEPEPSVPETGQESVLENDEFRVTIQEK